MFSKSKTLLLIAIFCLFGSLSFAQGFERLYPAGYEQSHGSVLVKTNDGGFLIGGRVDSADSKSPRLIKIDQDANVQWENNNLGLVEGRGDVSSIYVAADGTFFAAGMTKNDSIFLTKLDGAGQVLWSNLYPGQSPNLNIYSQVEISPVWINGSIDPANGWYLTWIDNGGTLSAARTDAAGVLIWQEVYQQAKLAPSRRFASKLSPTGQLTVAGRLDGLLTVQTTTISPDGLPTHAFFTIPNTAINNYTDIPAITWAANGNLLLGAWDPPEFVVSEYTPTGNLVWASTVFNQTITGWGWDARIVPLDNGEILASFNSLVPAFPDNYDVPVVKLSATGDIIWNKYFVPTVENFNYFSYDFVSTPDGGFAGVNSKLADVSNQESMTTYFFKASADGRSHQAIILGRVMKDIDLNCADFPTEQGLSNFPILATKNANTNFYATTDAEGYYSLDVDTGAYIVNVQTPNALWMPCQNDLQVVLPSVNDTALVYFPIQASSDCPQLSVQISTLRLRPCQNSTWNMEYCNTGTDSALNAYAIVLFDSLTTVVSATVPFVALPNNAYQFELGNIGSLDCGSVDIVTNLSCDAVLGQTLCAEAHIYPDSICGDTLGNRPILTVLGRCTGDQINFTVKNVGILPMLAPANYIVIEDDMIQLQTQGQIPILNAGGSTEIQLPATGSTYHLELEQAAGNPIWSMPSATVEGCGANPNFGFMSMFPPDDAAAFVDIYCREVVNSYDPNEKTAFPKGFGDEKYLEKNTDIEYNIGFQNTGNDTAYLVVLRDTLSQYLNPASIKMGASSHAYTWELLGQGILKITFSNINLLDSVSNEPASHGYVQFRISQQKDLIDGIQIHNSAAIYFDANVPVITNSVSHTIGRPFVVLTIDPSIPENQVLVSPNPFHDAAEITLINAADDLKTLTLLDMTGKTVSQQKVFGKKLSLNGKNLSPGVYFFHIRGANGYYVSGKVVVD